jgi:sulfate/thiosulfate transport system permease protein
VTAKARGTRVELPGRRGTLAATIGYLAVLVVIPLIALVAKASTMSWARMTDIVGSDRVLAAFRVSLVSSAIAAAFAVAFGVPIAWSLGRYKFPGHALLDAAVEVPLALPTSVAGITLTSLYGEHGPVGRLFAQVGIKIAFAPAGIVVALVFVSLPFAVRAVQAVVLEMDRQLEEAAGSLGATRLQTFWRIQLPILVPSIVTGFSLAFARGVGEYGSVIFISGNLPFKTEIGPLLVVTKLEQFDYEGAAALALLLLVASLLVLVFTQGLERWASRRFEGGRRKRRGGAT